MNTRRGIALGLGAYFVAVNVWACLILVPLSFRRSDFRQFYAGAYIVHSGEASRLYDFDYQLAVENSQVSSEPGFTLPFVSPAYEAILMSPLARLSYRAAFIAFTGISLLLLGCCCVLLRPWSSNLKTIYWWVPGAAIFGFMPIGTALSYGQDSIALLTLILCAFVLLGKGRERLAGAVLACALFKFQIVIPIALLFLLWRQWRFIQGFSLAAVLLGSISITFTAIAASRLYVESLLSIASINTAAHGMNQSMVLWQRMPNINGFMFGLFHGLLSAAWIKGATVVLSLGLLIFAAKTGRKIADQQKLMALAVPCAVLLGYHTYMHDVSVLILPMFLLLESNPKIGLALFIAPLIENVSFDLTYLMAVVIAAAILIISRTEAMLRLTDDLKARTSHSDTSLQPLFQ